MELRYGKPEEAGMSAERVRYVEDLMESWVKTGISQAIVILAARKGIIFSHKAFGRLTPYPDSPPVAVDSMYPLASLTKPITATCAMILLEKGLIDFYRPVSEYIPEFRGEGKNIVRVYHLLTHTSGMNDDMIREYARGKKGSVEIPPPEPTQHPGINEWLYMSYEAPLAVKPGTEMTYCNYGYQLIGEIVRRVSGKSLDDFARENIFQPLGMKDTFYIVPDQVFDRVIRRKPQPGSDIDWFSDPEKMRTPTASGGVYSTVKDMAVFGQMFLNKGIYSGKRILSTAAVTEMTRNQIPGISSKYGEELFRESFWGYGWNVRGTKTDNCGILRSPASINHGGHGGVALWVDPVYETTLVYFSVDAKEYLDLFNNAMIAAVEA